MSDSAELLEALCAGAASSGASDVVLLEGRIPQFRIGGTLSPVAAEPSEEGLFACLRAACKAPENALDFDGAYRSACGRFRVNLYGSLGRRGAVMRRIRADVPALEELDLPVHLLREWASRSSGLILVSGPTGSGKSTTLAALLGHMNGLYSRHVITIEDPVEFEFADGTCLFTQREVGIDTPSFAEGLRRAMRQSPDVIFIGEIRDAESAGVALRASETGHLVLASLHASSVAESVGRMEVFVTPDQRDGLRRILSAQLAGVLCQRLIPSGEGRVLACEYFTNVGLARKLVAEGRESDLADFVARGDGREALPLSGALLSLVKSGAITEADAAPFMKGQLAARAVGIGRVR